MQIGVGLPATIPGVTGPEILEWARRADAGGYRTYGSVSGESVRIEDHRSSHQRQRRNLCGLMCSRADAPHSRFRHACANSSSKR